MPIGPQLPPHLAGRTADPNPDSDPTPARSTTPLDDEEDEEDDFGPALPPELAAKRKTQPKQSAIGPSLPSSIGPSVGPSLPSSASLSRAPVPGPSVGPSVGPSRGPSFPGPSYDDDDDDDLIGPRLGDASGPQMSAADEFRAREERWAKEREKAKEGPAKPKREEWMLVPPTSGVLSSVDPLKRPTAFNKASRAEPGSTDHTIWTETPAEKAKRLADELAGIKRPAAQAGHDDDAEVERKRQRQRDREIQQGIEHHNKSSRGESLLDQHKRKKKENPDDEPPVIWDRDKMMGVSGRILSDQERAQKIKDAGGLSDRFGHGKGGAYYL